MLWPSIVETLAALPDDPAYAALRKLIERYAKVIDGLPEHGDARTRDQAWGLRWIGPELLRALDALGATPEAKARIDKLASAGKGGGGKPDASGGKLPGLRSALASRSAP